MVKLLHIGCRCSVQPNIERMTNTSSFGHQPVTKSSARIGARNTSQFMAIIFTNVSYFGNGVLRRGHKRRAMVIPIPLAIISISHNCGKRLSFIQQFIGIFWGKYIDRKPQLVAVVNFKWNAVAD